MGPRPSSQPYYDLGDFQRLITTRNADCQVWFNRGLIWAYSFCHEEAVNCFERALEHDPTCPMAHWGVAYSSGPHYNKSWELFDQADLETSLKKTHAAAQNAIDHLENASPVEKALIKALRFRYQNDTPVKSYSGWNTEYADAMREVYRDYGDDLDVAAIYVDAQMCLTPWQLWDLRTGLPGANTRTIESKQALEKALTVKAAWKHPGLLHSYVHLIEMSPEPELALKAADVLRTLCPDAGHLCHMPSHLDILVGEYRAAIAANAKAIIADEKYVADVGAQNFYLVYRLHDYHSLVYAAMFAGQSEVALETVDKMEAALPEEFLRIETPPMATWAETVHSVRPHVLIRFGRWDDIIAAELPKDQNLYCVTVATMHYAKAIAYAAKGQVGKAADEQQLFEEAVKRVPKSRMAFPNKALDILAIGKAMLDGELEYRRGNYDVAFEHLQKAVGLDDNLIYSEPWGWMLPTRHAFAALLLEQGHVEKAAALYRADLGFDKTLPRARQHPNNVWALHGYHECLRKLEKHAEADLLDLQLKVALSVTDVDIKSSCFCRLDTEPAVVSDGILQDNGCCSNGHK